MNNKKEFRMFNLNEVEFENYIKWEKKLPKKYMKHQLSFTFTYTGIGIGIVVKRGDKEKDITDYSCW